MLIHQYNLESGRSNRQVQFFVDQLELEFILHFFQLLSYFELAGQSDRLDALSMVTYR